MCIECFHEALRRYNSNEGRDGNYLTLDDSHTIVADPNWNEIALACAIEEHRHKVKQHD